MGHRLNSEHFIISKLPSIFLPSLSSCFYFCLVLFSFMSLFMVISPVLCSFSFFIKFILPFLLSILSSSLIHHVVICFIFVPALTHPLNLPPVLCLFLLLLVFHFFSCQPPSFASLTPSLSLPSSLWLHYLFAYCPLHFIILFLSSLFIFHLFCCSSSSSLHFIIQLTMLLQFCISLLSFFLFLFFQILNFQHPRVLINLLNMHCPISWSDALHLFTKGNFLLQGFFW